MIGRRFPARIGAVRKLVEVDADPQEGDGKAGDVALLRHARGGQAVAQRASAGKLGRGDPKRGGVLLQFGPFRRGETDAKQIVSFLLR